MLLKGLKLLKIIGLCSLGVCGLVGGLASTYFLVPNKTEVIDLGGMDGLEDELPPTHFARLIGKLAPIADAGLDDPLKIRADFDDVTIEWPNNNIKLDGELTLNMSSLQDIQATLDLDVNYNEKHIDLGIGYVDETIYLATKDLALKANIGEDENESEFLDLIDRFNYLFLDQNNENGMRISVNSSDSFLDILMNFISDGVLPKITMSKPGEEPVPEVETGNELEKTASKKSNSVLDKLGDLTNLLSNVEITETVDNDVVITSVKINIGVDENNQPNDLILKLFLDSESLAIEKVDLGTIKLGDVVISGSLNCEMNDMIEVYPMDSENYTYKNRGEFQSVFGYGAWLDDIFTLLNTRTLGLDFNASFAENNQSLAILNGSIDVDASRFEMFNLIDTVFNIAYEEANIDESELEEGETIAERAIKRIDSEKIHGTIDEVINVLNDFDLNVNLSVKNFVNDGQGQYIANELSNLNLAYMLNNEGEHAGYLTLNEDAEDAVLKAKVDVETVNNLIDKILEIIDLVEGRDELTSKNLKRPTKGLIDEFTSNDFINAINNGDFSGILDIIKDLRTTENTIELTIDASPFGLGENATVKLILSCLKEVEIPKVINIELSELKLGAVSINASLNTRKINKAPFEKILLNESSFIRLDFLNGIAEQATTILGNKRANVGIKGSILDEQQLGFDFDGWTQFDYGNENGFGSILFNEYKTSHDEPLTPHTVDLSIDNFDNDHSKNKLFFEYREKLCGTFTLKTFDDIIILFQNLMSDTDSKFYKLVSPLISDSIMSVLGDIVKEQTSPISKLEEDKLDEEEFSLLPYVGYLDYFNYAKKDYIKEIKETNFDNGSALDVVITKDLLSFLGSGDLHLQLTFRNKDDGSRELNSIKLIDLAVGGKTINAEIILNEYDSSIENPVEVENEAKFLDFSDIAILLELGIKTIDYDYYHLTANAKIKLSLFSFLKLDLINAQLDLKIWIDGSTFKLYGKVNNPIPLIENGVCEFTYISDPTTSKIADGWVDILYTDKGTLLSGFKSYQHLYRAESQYFFDNAVGYIINAMFDLDPNLTNSLINSAGTSTGGEDPQWQNLILENGFKYTFDSNDNSHRWDIGLNIASIAGKDTIGDLTGYITGLDVERTVDDYVISSRVLTKIHVETNIGGMLPIVLDLDFANPTNTDSSWDAKTDARFNLIRGIYDKLDDSAKASAYNNLTGYKESGATSLETK